MACNHADHRQGGRVWLVNHGSDTNTYYEIEQMLDEYGCRFERVVLHSRVGATNNPLRGVPVCLWNTNPNNDSPYGVGGEAINARGSSAQTTPLVLGTPGLLPGAPTNVRIAQPPVPARGADDQRGDALVVSWTAPAAQTGIPP